MTDPISFVSSTPRLALPLLFAGQTQKEYTVNEAIARIDAVLHPAIEGEAGGPPASPAEGECWLVGDSPSGAWAGHAGELACFSLGTWLFVEPCDGIRVLNRLTGQLRLRRYGGWASAGTPTAPSGGTTVDVEARTAITGLIAALADSGILPAAG
ncbi:MAG: DUF2793 domain-containing protein [Candidatus Andeanibacterium colombiense]|uniref:DUF2793 domain-containing protein n=1 Tax=Candidatus Andeanibacterium colombiense TaxID=3121345 RepID=A0AAJ5X4E0_9SPHN|nr:MAG: DUF2793 domain-containing protein [Sphingomonadaceae bacterium]